MVGPSSEPIQGMLFLLQVGLNTGFLIVSESAPQPNMSCCSKLEDGVGEDGNMGDMG